MKKILLSTLLTSLCPLFAMAGVQVSINNIVYELDMESNTAIVSDGSAGKPSEVVIPESVNYEGVSYAVTGIGDHAFCECFTLTSVSIPEGVTSIGNETFYGCSSLTSVSIPASVTDISRGVFEGCSNLVSISIPEGVENIEESTFVILYLPHERFPPGELT